MIFEPFFTTKPRDQGNGTRPLHGLRHSAAIGRGRSGWHRGRTRAPPSPSGFPPHRAKESEKAVGDGIGLAGDRARHHTLRGRRRRRASPRLAPPREGGTPRPPRRERRGSTCCSRKATAPRSISSITDTVMPFMDGRTWQAGAPRFFLPSACCSFQATRDAGKDPDDEGLASFPSPLPRSELAHAVTRALEKARGTNKASGDLAYASAPTSGPERKLVEPGFRLPHRARAQGASAAAAHPRRRSR